MSHTGETTGTGLRGAAGAVHGVGEAIRGTINTAADSAMGSKSGVAKNQAITDRGIDEIQTGRYHGTGAGVTPADTAAERHNRAAQGEYPSTTHGTTGFGSSGPAHAGATAGSHYPSTTTHDGAYNTSGTTGAAGYDNPRSTNAGPHSTNLANTIDSRVDSDRSQQYGTTHGSSSLGSTGTHGTSDLSSTGTHGTSGLSSTGTHGTTGSHNTSGLGSTGTHGTTGSHIQHDNPHSSNAGPHSSNLGNRVDPNVDSDLDKRRGSAHTAGLQGAGGLSGATSHRGSGINPTEIPGGYTTAETTTGHSGVGENSGVPGAHGSHPGNTQGQYDNPKSSNHGPHGSNLLNKLDPRNDSDADHRGVHGTTGTHGTTTGTHGTTTGTHGTHGTHGTTTGTHGTHGTHGTTTGAGYGTTGTTGSHVQHDNPHSTNAGLHESNIANKADPRFDSDLDHRGAAGTHTGTHTGTTGTTGHTTGTHDVTGTHGTHGTTSHATGTHDTTGVRPDGTKTDAHPSHGTGLVGKVLDTVDPRVKKA
ncbi:hypothetical protein SLS56_001174 [Neofusicoccum ribis]|uniref:Cell surface protein n=1 Tax=Neofusicoccum ribis TaxID=45134 RepID=A0ABR3TAJ9_9PEZI